MTSSSSRSQSTKTSTATCKNPSPRTWSRTKTSKKEYEAQWKFLDNSVRALKQRLEKEKTLHKEDNNAVMNENQKLLKEIKDLRNVIADKNTEFSQLGGIKQLKIVHKKIEEREKMIEEAQQRDQGFTANQDNYDNSDEKQIQIKKRYIEQLRQRREQLEIEHQQLQQMPH